MQYVDQNGMSYVSRMTWEEKEQLCSYLKPIKLYDCAYFMPDEGHTIVLGLRSNSIIASYVIPIVLSGKLCITLPPFINLTNSIVQKIGVELGLSLTLGLQDMDIVFPTLDDTISKYLYIQQNTQFMLYEDYILYTPAYHMIDKIISSYISIERYKQNSNISILNDDTCLSVADQIRSMKADDGAKLICIDNHIVTIMSSLLPLNKKDKLNISIYDDPSRDRFVVEYKVSKDKNIDNLVFDVMHLRV